MKKLCWFTHTNISSKDPKPFSFPSDQKEQPDFSYDLSEFLSVFIDNELWNKKKYREEYSYEFGREDLEKIKSIKFHFHCKRGPFSNAHGYERVLDTYINRTKLESGKILSSGISRASKIVVIEVDFHSENKIIDNLSYDEEKDIDIVFGKKLTEENLNAWNELKRIKAIICEFIQFFNFNLHLNYLTQDYEFSFSDKPNLIGFTTVTEEDYLYYETDQIDFFAHYILHDRLTENLPFLMNFTSKTWHKEVPSIHFFLDALKGNNITATNFIKLVFTLESFFSTRISNDFMLLIVPLILSKDIRTMKSTRELLKASFNVRNDIVHGGKLLNISSPTGKKGTFETMEQLFFELKNVITQIFYFYINEKLDFKEKINHEMVFKLLPRGINKG